MHIVTDSAADLSAEEAQRLGIAVIPLFVQFPEGEVSSTQLTADEFYNRLRAMAPTIPTTSQPAPGMIADIFQHIGAPGETVLSLHLSSGLSGTIQAARAGARLVTDRAVVLVDCLTLSTGQRYQVLAADMAAKAGWLLPDILKLLERVRANTETIFTLDTLDYLARGGRIGRVSALAGALLQIKPIIHVDKIDGKYSTVGRGRTLNQAMSQIVDELVKIYADKPLWLTVMNGQMPDKTERLAELLSKRLKVARLETRRVSPALGVHTGPGVIGVGAVPMDLFDSITNTKPQDQDTSPAAL